jgi:hypothetical protein
LRYNPDRDAQFDVSGSYPPLVQTGAARAGTAFAVVDFDLVNDSVPINI